MLKALQHKLNNEKAKVIADQLLFSGINFIMTLVIAKALSTADFGVYASIILAIYLIISLGNAFIIQPFQVASTEFRNSNDYALFLLINQIAFTIIVTVISFIVCQFFLPHYFSILSMLWMAVGIILHDYFRKYFLAKSNINSVLCIDVIVAISQTVILLYILSVKQIDISSLLALLGVSYFSAVLVALYVIGIRFTKTMSWKQFFTYHRQEGGWLSLVSFVQWASGNLLVASLGLFISLEALGAFRLIQSLFGVLNVLFQTFENYVLPKATTLYSQSVQLSKSYIRNTSFQSTAAVGIVLIVLFFSSNNLMAVVSGGKFAAYGYVLKGMCVLYFILFIGYPIRLSIRMLLLNKLFFVGYVLSFVFTAICFQFLLKHWQLNGVIIGLIANQLIMLLFWNYQLTKKGFYLWK